MRYSVIIPTYNRPEALKRCLQGFLNLDYVDWELIVVNDGGQEPLIIEQLPIQVINTPHAGPAAARNAGAAIAQGDYLAFTDDDCVPGVDWLHQFDMAFEKTGYEALGGGWINPHPENTAAEAAQIYMEFLRGYFRDTQGNILLLPSNNVAYRRDIFESLGGFDESFPLAAAEDLDLSYRIVAAGYRQGYVPDAKIYHYHRNTYRGYLKQQWRYGRGAFYFNRKPQPIIHHIQRNKGEFHMRLARYLWQEHVSPSIWILLGLTPIAHGLGKRYERLSHQRLSVS